MNECATARGKKIRVNSCNSWTMQGLCGNEKQIRVNSCNSWTMQGL